MSERLRLAIRKASTSRHFSWVSTITITLIAAAFRFINLSSPHELVFDETYYVKDAYTLGQTGAERKWPEDPNPQFESGQLDIFLEAPSFVVHPPFGKWLIWLGMSAFGADNSFGWRFSTALIGTLLIPLVVLAAKLLIGSKVWAAAIGLALAIEGQAIVLSRTAILDVLLTFFILLGFVFLLLDDRAWRRKLRHSANQGRSLPIGLRPWLFATGIAIGLATAIKWSGLWVLAGFGLYSVISEVLLRRRLGGSVLKGLIPQGLLSFLSLVPLALASYVASWLGWILGDDGYRRQPERGWIAPLWDYHVAALNFHSGLDSDHGYRANALEWLLTLRPTSFYFEQFESGESGCSFDVGCTQAITALPHLIIWLSAVFALPWLAYRIFQRDRTASLIFLGFALNWAPWLLLLSRTTFQFYAVVFTPFLILGLGYLLYRWQRHGYLTGRVAQRERTLIRFGILNVVWALAFVTLWLGLFVPKEFWRIQLFNPGWI